MNAALKKSTISLMITCLLPWPSHAGVTDISDKPLASTSSDSVKPNIMFILDDSGSMELQFMPDGLESKTNTIGIRNGVCNTVYYNPALTYETPQTVVGTTTKVIEDINSASPTTFTSAYEDGFYSYTGRSLATYPRRNLSTSFRAFQDDIFGVSRGYDTEISDPAQPAYYWTYLGSSTLTPNSGDCNKTLSSSTDSTTTEYCTDNTRTTTTCAAAGKTALWRKTIVTGASGPGSTDERQNFANWYSYYRQRLTMMKSAAGKAFLGLGSKYRVGFITINPGNPVSSNRFLKVDEFNIDQKKLWIERLYKQDDNGSTPLREALSRVGSYYGGLTSGLSSGMITDTINRTDDPVQYSCQQNFSILTTDGYWNGNAGKTLSGGSIGNQDGAYGALGAATISSSERIPVVTYPIYDGATSTRTTKDASNLYAYSSCVLPQAQKKIVQWQSRPLQAGEVITQIQKREGIWQRRVGNLQRRKSTNSGGSWGSWTDRDDCTWDNQGSTQYQCRYVLGSWQNTSDCTANPPGTLTTDGTQWVGDSVECQVVWGSWGNAGSCTPVSTGQNRRECQNIPVSSNVVASCTPGTTAGGLVTTCTSVPTGAWTDTTGTCTASSTVGCQSIVVSDWTNISSCTPSGPDGSGQETLCQTVASATPGNKIIATTTYTTTTTQMSGDQQVGAPTTSTTTNTFDYDATCYASAPALPSPNPKRPTGSQLPTAPAGCAEWPCVTNSAPSGGTSDTLADVAQYYYITDLRTCDWDTMTDAQRNATGMTETAYCLANGTRCAGGVSNVNVCENNVPKGAQSQFPDEDDKAHWQHMTTFTMGLGLTGVTSYTNNYRTATSGAFQNIRDGSANWPNPANSDAAKLDDLWHAAVNGRGLYFSASNPQEVSTGLSNALAGINDRVGSAAAAATSNLEPVSGDNYAFTAKYTTGVWTGDLEAKEINLSDGTVSGTPIWSGAAKLAEKAKPACDKRVIKLFRDGATNNLVNFTWNTYTCDASGNPTGTASTELSAAEKAYFDEAKITTFDQYPFMSTGSSSTVNQPPLAAGANLVNYLRGQRGFEGFVTDSASKLYRTRQAVLGDIVNAQPVYVRKPFAQYTDAGYADFKAANSARRPVVYVAANDGMLHAFDADPASGEELWAFIPTMSLPELHKLADTGYATKHRYFTDGTPVVGDFFDSADAVPKWKTMLVAGMNKGGKGYYALDITDPTTPKALWEFTDADMGFSFGNPMIVKLMDGQWVVLVTSGLNNADGKGYLYILEAGTGSILHKIATSAGSAANPSGLNKIVGWAVGDPIKDNTVNHVYGADLLGNIWRFDVNDIPAMTPSGREATLLATAKDGGGIPQPITTRPELAQVGPDIFVYVGTGRYLGDSDPATTQQQSIYGIKDTLAMPTVAGAPVIADLRGTLTKQTISQTGSGLAAVRSVDGCAVATSGWYVELPDSGERINVDMKLQLGSLVAGSNVPIPSACRVGGYSWLNYFNITNGCAVNSSDTQKKVGQRLSDSLVVGLNVIRLPTGKTVVVATTSDAKQPTLTPPFSVGDPEGRRLTWRELVP